MTRDGQVFRDDETGAYGGEVFLRDGKTEVRRRTVPITGSLCRELLLRAGDKTSDEPVFGIDYLQMDYPWKQVRAAAGRKHVRFKDFRAQTAIHGEEAQIP